MLTPTLRRNGKHLITVRTTHHVDRAIMTSCIASDQGEIDPNPAALATLTRSKVEEIVREQLGMYGDDIDMRVIDYSPEQIAAVEQRVRELFPDLD